ncbi:hypothetical protein JRQ81_008682 [Phrynocephalus forsythii]|uniref:MARVEL domain-containing protein 2 n=1 Tax=Phrynocephalus forsythii TaxID=171643 RepID=A0A9Q1ASN6_9SAUR|nr:hypothetical protein JRQ81_008682 [Phrynocephalus forsythii]
MDQPGSSPPGPGGSSPEGRAPLLKPVRHFVPPSWKDFLLGWRRRPGGEIPLSRYTPEDLPISPPASPLLGLPKKALSEGRESVHEDQKEGSGSGGEEDGKGPPAAPAAPLPAAPSQGGWSTPPPGYQERLAAYESKYAFLRSWPGLLRLLGALELILGGLVFACTAAYIQKDYQWSQLYGGGQWPYGGYGYSSYGPMTPFVLVVASLAWLVTVILLGLGVTLHYRSILLRAHWWPLTEFGLNLSLSLLYLAASLAYVQDVNRGGLCYSLLAANPLVSALCRVGGGQVAALAFLFLTTFLYLAGALVCLRMWQHEGARRTPAFLAVPGGQASPALWRDAPEPTAAPRPSRKAPRRVEFSEKSQDAEVMSCAIPTGYNPRPHLVPDYILRYPAIGSPEEREKYKAVFNDQYGEYQELHRDVREAQRKFHALEAALAKLPRRDPGQEVDQGRVSAVRKEYERQRKDPTFREKRERCAYLKGKLGHLKGRIQAYDREKEEVGQGGSSAYF